MSGVVQGSSNHVIPIPGFGCRNGGVRGSTEILFWAPGLSTSYCNAVDCCRLTCLIDGCTALYLRTLLCDEYHVK